MRRRSAAGREDAGAEAGARPSAALRARQAVVPVAILLVATVLRLWGIRWGLPDGQDYASYHPDETVNLVNAVLDDGALRPHLDIGFYNYGSFYFLLWQVAAAVNHAYGFVRIAGSASIGEADPTTTVAALLLVGRLLSAACGVLTVAVLFAVGRRLYSRKAGLVAGAIYAIAPVAVVNAQYATVDATATFLVAATLAPVAALLDRPTLRMAVAAGALAGLAAATRYNTAIVLCAVLVACWSPREPWRPAALRASVAVGAAIAAFIAGCPGVVLNWDRFHADVMFEAAKSMAGMGNLFRDTGPGWIYHATVSFRYGLAMPLLLLTAAGIIHSLVARERRSAPLLALVIPFYFLMSMAEVRFLRYILPLVPPLALLTARFVTGSGCEPPWRGRATGAAFAAIALMTLFVSGAMSAAMARPDPRDLARDYIRRALPAGATIAFATTPAYYTPRLLPEFGAPTPGAVRRRMVLSAESPWTLRLPAEGTEWDLAVLAEPEPDMVILSDAETQEVERLREPRGMAFLAAVRSRYAPRTFANVPSIFGLSLGRPAWLPNDWLYTQPRVWLYERRP